MPASTRFQTSSWSSSESRKPGGVFPLPIWIYIRSKFSSFNMFSTRLDKTSATSTSNLVLPTVTKQFIFITKFGYPVNCSTDPSNFQSARISNYLCVFPPADFESFPDVLCADLKSLRKIKYKKTCHVFTVEIVLWGFLEFFIVFDEFVKVFNAFNRLTCYSNRRTGAFTHKSKIPKKIAQFLMKQSNFYEK